MWPKTSLSSVRILSSYGIIIAMCSITCSYLLIQLNHLMSHMCFGRKQIVISLCLHSHQWQIVEKSRWNQIHWMLEKCASNSLKYILKLKWLLRIIAHRLFFRNRTCAKTSLAANFTILSCTWMKQLNCLK